MSGNVSRSSRFGIPDAECVAAQGVKGSGETRCFCPQLAARFQPGFGFDSERYFAIISDRAQFSPIAIASDPRPSLCSTVFSRNLDE